ncbi:cytochrome C oxidase assembly protein [Ralstonia solanacearum]|nr:cytochrome C oxidase assembly protein [Ralstonia solanacearum]
MTKQNTNITNPMPITRNEGWGFYGTMREHAIEAWPLAMTAVSNATGASLESARRFLDSGFGRHFADEVLNALHAGQTLAFAIDGVTGRWMEYRIGRQASHTYDIPRGLPRLTGFVSACDIAHDLAD